MEAFMNVALIDSISSQQVTPLSNNNYPSNVHAVITTEHKKVKSGYAIVPHLLVEQVIQQNIEKLKEYSSTGRSGLILASGNTYWSGYELNRKNPVNFAVFKPLALATTNIYAGRLAQSIGYTDYISTDSTACISVYNATFLARALLDADMLDRVLIVAVEDATSSDLIEFFGKYGGHIGLDDEAKGKLPSAFDDTNTGFRVGHGAGIMLLDNNDSGVATINQINITAEKHNSAIGQSESGEGYKKALAGIDTEGYHIIKTHGTGTVSNNLAEANAIKSVFSDFVATSYKPLIGHTMGAHGIIELDMLLTDLRRGTLTGIPNRTSTDGQFISKDTNITDNKAICLASGMGNGYAAMTVNIS